jgi:hypothetical protein
MGPSKWQAMGAAILIFFMFLCPSVCTAQTGFYSTDDPELLGDPVSPGAPNHIISKPYLCTTKTTYVVDGDVLDYFNKALLSGVLVNCLNADSVIIASAETDSSGLYHFDLPNGFYQIIPSCLGYKAVSRKVFVWNANVCNLDIPLYPVTTSAGYFQMLNGDLAEGGVKDITMQNNKIAMCIASSYCDAQLGSSTKGKPVDFSTVGGVDGFDWINMPLVSSGKIYGYRGGALSMSRNVQFSAVNVLESSNKRSQVLASGKCQDVSLDVTSLYSIYPNQEWMEVTSTFYNNADTAVTVWLGDAMDNDEACQTSAFPGLHSEKEIIVSQNPEMLEYKPSRPWMGCFGYSSQAFGIYYSGDFAKDFTVSANSCRIVSQKQVTIPVNGTYTMTRKLAAIVPDTMETKYEALEGFYATQSLSVYGLKIEQTVEDDTVTVGQKVLVEMAVTNTNRSTSFPFVKGVLKLPENILANNDSIQFDEIAPGQTVRYVWELTPTNGGGFTKIPVELWMEDDCFFNNNFRLYVPGNGWYAGDNHVHTRYSDGASTSREVVNAGRNFGLSFMTITDHNGVRVKEDIPNLTTDAFLPMVGSEVTTFSGHALSLFCDNFIPWDSLRTSTLDDAQKIIDNINKGGVHPLSYIAHPFLNGAIWKWLDVVNVTGYEMYNGYVKMRSPEMYKAFALWDSKLKSGKKVYGISNSDAHDAVVVGAKFIRAYLENVTPESVLKAINLGHFYGTNGPDVRFTVDSVQMGGALEVETTKKVCIRMEGYSYEKMDSLKLIKNGKLLKSFVFDDMQNRASAVVYDDASVGDYYRMEVVDWSDRLAFSNPVFIVSSKTHEPFGEDTLVYGIDDPVYSTELCVYPNPTSEFVVVRAPKAIDGILTVTDVSGKIWIINSFHNSCEEKLDVRSLPKGLYLLRINNDRRKLIVR